tara:strand:- start:25 stop:216 length:192 start_codon:yes stop_codon:yes gene_type:complete
MSNIPKLDYNNLSNMSKEQLYFCFLDLQKYSIEKLEELEEKIENLKEKNKKLRIKCNTLETKN